MAQKVNKVKATVRSRPLSVSAKRNIEGWLFVSPLLLGFLVFVLGPLIISFVLSFTEYHIFNPPKFVGFENYQRAFLEDPAFKNVLLNSAYFSLGVIPFTIVFGLILAVVLNRKISGVPFTRAIAFLPYVCTWTAIGLVWKLMYHPDFGVINWLLGSIGLKALPWLESTKVAMPAVIITHIWKEVGFDMLVYIAALQGIPEELYEAAYMDGASWLQTVFRITIPLLTPVTFFLITIHFIVSFQAFDSILIMTGGGPASSTRVVVYHIWETAFSFLNMGYASSFSWVVFVAIFIVTSLQWKLRKQWVFIG